MRLGNPTILLVMGLAACSDSLPIEQHAVGGALQLALTGSDIHGQTYRLRDAQFQISGCADYYQYGGGYAGGSSGGAGYGGAGGSECVTKLISSEDNPDGDLLVERLLPGEYTVTLLGNWYLEQLAANGPMRADQVVLLSPTTQYAYVWDGGVSSVLYSFGVGGDLIDFRHGDISIGISVEQPGDHDCTGYPFAGAGGTGSSNCPPVAGSEMRILVVPSGDAGAGPRPAGAGM